MASRWEDTLRAWLPRRPTPAASHRGARLRLRRIRRRVSVGATAAFLGAFGVIAAGSASTQATTSTVAAARGSTGASATISASKTTAAPTTSSTLAAATTSRS